jgi:NAD(P)H-dependent FMN reductase/rhodanese-related sulfurtransferase
VDVHNPGEVTAAPVTGARSLTLAGLREHLGELDRAEPVVLFCASGTRSAIANGLLRASGFADVSDVLGGAQTMLSTCPLISSQLEVVRCAGFHIPSSRSPAVPDQPLEIAVIVGSTREGRFADTVARWFTDQIRQRSDMLVDVIDLADVGLPAVLPRHPPPAVQAYAERVERADGFVVVTPEYNHSFPASLKQAIDAVLTPWRRKPVAFVCYGGVSGGLRAVEQLRPVFAELHATTIRETVSLPMAPMLFDRVGELIDPTGPTAAAKTMLDDLAWWASALRTARDAHVVDEGCTE